MAANAPSVKVSAIWSVVNDQMECDNERRLPLGREGFPRASECEEVSSTDSHNCNARTTLHSQTCIQRIFSDRALLGDTARKLEQMFVVQIRITRRLKLIWESCKSPATEAPWDDPRLQS